MEDEMERRRWGRITGDETKEIERKKERNAEGRETVWREHLHANKCDTGSSILSSNPRCTGYSFITNIGESEMTVRQHILRTVLQGKSEQCIMSLKYHRCDFTQVITQSTGLPSRRMVQQAMSSVNLGKYAIGWYKMAIPVIIQSIHNQIPWILKFP
jgi:hypothetical protein